MDGRTGNLVAKEGNLVTANTTDLITINQVQSLYVTFAVPESKLTAIKQHMAEGRLPVMAKPQDESAPEESGFLSFCGQQRRSGHRDHHAEGSVRRPVTTGARVDQAALVNWFRARKTRHTQAQTATA